MFKQTMFKSIGFGNITTSHEMRDLQKVLTVVTRKATKWSFHCILIFRFADVAFCLFSHVSENVTLLQLYE